MCVCNYNLYASMRLSSPPDDENERKEEVKVVVYISLFFLSLSLTAHPILFSRWGNLRALTKWESIIFVPFNPVARRPPLWSLPTSCSSFFFFFFYRYGMNFHNNTTAGCWSAAVSFDQNFQSTQPNSLLLSNVFVHFFFSRGGILSWIEGSLLAQAC
jgi:hypothetical protein